MKFKDLDKKLIIIVVISIVAIFNAIYLSYMAYTVNLPQDTGLGQNSGSYACSSNAPSSCSSIFQNDFSWIFGIPFSLIDLFVYPVIVLIALLGLYKKVRNHYKVILALVVGGFFLNGYIIINEFLISTYCILCLLFTMIIIINGGLSIKGFKESR